MSCDNVMMVYGTKKSEVSGEFMSAGINASQSVYLDLTRGLAAQAVLIGHAYSMAFPSQFLVIQNLGVEIFLFMSGFLICLSALQRRERVSYGFRMYFEDRFFRIFVPVIPALLLVPVIDMIATMEFSSTSDLRTWIGNLFMLQNHPLLGLVAKVGHIAALDIDSYGSARQLWTVALEWWLYMFFGYVLLCRKNMIALLILGIVPFFSFIRGGAGDPLGPIWFAGVACGFLHYRLGAPSLPRSTATILILALVAAGTGRILFSTYVTNGFHWSAFHFYDLPFSIILMSGLVIGYLACGRVMDHLKKPAKFLADYSYSLYLIHLSVIVCLQQLTFDHSWSFLFMAIVVGNVAGFLFWALFERWHLTIKAAYRRQYAKSFAKV